MFVVRRPFESDVTRRFWFHINMSRDLVCHVGLRKKWGRGEVPSVF